MFFVRIKNKPFIFHIHFEERVGKKEKKVGASMDVEYKRPKVGVV